MTVSEAISKFQRDCFAHYVNDIGSRVKGFPIPYEYPDGNPIRPVVPVYTNTGKIMVIGAFPSARFERRDGRLIPIADNLSPFGPEKYFDGREVRIQESTDRLITDYLKPLGLTYDDLWVTDIVKVYLYPKKHIDNCSALFPSKHFANTHEMFDTMAREGIGWIQREVDICKPKLIVTLGEVCARAMSHDRVTSTKELLDGKIIQMDPIDAFKIVHLAHPEIRRRNREWDEKTREQIHSLKKAIGGLL